MKVKQKNIRIFDINIEDEQEFFEYFEKNLIILKEYFLFLSGKITPTIENYLHEKGICFKDINGCDIKSFQKHGNSHVLNSPEKVAQSSVVVQEKNVCETIKPKIVNKTLRSGEEIIHDGSVVVFGRVNSGAKIISEGSVEVFGVVDGMIQCDGDYMILKGINKGHVIFNGDILDNEEFDDKLKKVIKHSEGYMIKDVF